METKKAILIIMDGWGLGKIKSSDAIQNADVPFVTSLYKKYPNTTLITCGEDVGLPAGQMGNSEVGHLNLGAGRIVYQELERINVFQFDLDAQLLLPGRPQGEIGLAAKTPLFHIAVTHFEIHEDVTQIF